MEAMSFFSEYQQEQIRRFASATHLLRMLGSLGQHGALQEVFASSAQNLEEPSTDALKSATDLFGELSIYSAKAKRFTKMSLIGLAILIAGSISIWITNGIGPGLFWMIISIIFWFALTVIFQLRHMPRIRKRFGLTNAEGAFALNHIVGNPRWQMDMLRHAKMSR